MEASETKQLLELIEQWTRSEIMARHSPLLGLDLTDYARGQVEKIDEIRRLVFGTDDLVKLGIKWGLLKNRKDLAKEATIKQFQDLQKELAKMVVE